MIWFLQILPDPPFGSSQEPEPKRYCSGRGKEVIRNGPPIKGDYGRASLKNGEVLVAKESQDGPACGGRSGSGVPVMVGREEQSQREDCEPNPQQLEIGHQQLPPAHSSSQ